MSALLGYLLAIACGWCCALTGCGFFILELVAFYLMTTSLLALAAAYYSLIFIRFYIFWFFAINPERSLVLLFAFLVIEWFF